MAADSHPGYTKMAITSQPIFRWTWCLVLGWGLRLSVDFYHRGLYTRTAVARNPSVSWAFLCSVVVAHISGVVVNEWIALLLNSLSLTTILWLTDVIICIVYLNYVLVKSCFTHCLWTCVYFVYLLNLPFLVNKDFDWYCSYGVVLWEMLTSETPYKGLEDHQVIFGVGSNKLSLPIPATCPQRFKQLLQCMYR